MRIENLEKVVFDTLNGINTFEKLENILDFYGTGNLHNLSPENMIAIYGQNPNVSLVGTYDAWKKCGRYPLKNSGIAVYPFNTSGVFGKFSDYVFDISGTKGNDMDIWKLSGDMRKEFFEQAKHSEDSSLENFSEVPLPYRYIVSESFSNIKEMLETEHTELLCHDETRDSEIVRFLAECTFKAFLKRCDISYSLPVREKETFEKLAAAGATVVEVTDKAPWVEACQPTIQANTADQAELYQQLLDMQ